MIGVDVGRVLGVIEELVKVHKFYPENIKRDWYIQFDAGTYGIKKITEFGEFRDDEVLRHPDIIIFKDGKLYCVIEHDGSWHNTKPGVRQTEKRNQDYDYAKIPYIVINPADLKLIKKPWKEYLAEELGNIERYK